MKKFKIMLSLITITILLTSCGFISNLYPEEKYGDWTNPSTEQTRTDQKMKTEIHPSYEAIKVVCSCGNAFETRSTSSKDEIHIDVCSSCHPFYTGKQKIVDTAGRVEKFKSRYGAFKR